MSIMSIKDKKCLSAFAGLNLAIKQCWSDGELCVVVTAIAFYPMFYLIAVWMKYHYLKKYGIDIKSRNV